jgi:hypothetical protein
LHLHSVTFLLHLFDPHESLLKFYRIYIFKIFFFLFCFLFNNWYFVAKHCCIVACQLRDFQRRDAIKSIKTKISISSLVDEYDFHWRWNDTINTCTWHLTHTTCKFYNFSLIYYFSNSMFSNTKLSGLEDRSAVMRKICIHTYVLYRKSFSSPVSLWTFLNIFITTIHIMFIIYKTFSYVKKKKKIRLTAI